MRQYQQLLCDVLAMGKDKDDRTGTGTRSLFGYQMRFELSAGFPLVTTKKTHLKSIIHELLWLISGDTNIKYLQENGVNIWNEWASPDGDLGPVYGHSWRKWGATPESVSQPKPRLRRGVSPTYLGVANGEGKGSHPLGKTWEGMVARCYDPCSASYATYGAVGVHVCDDWLEFSQFAKDAVLLPGYVEESEVRKVLDKDIKGQGFTYSKGTCQWVTDLENAQAKAEWVYTLEKDGVLHSFTNSSQFGREHGIESKNLSDLWTGRKNAKIREGFRFVSKKKINPGIDQLNDLVTSIRSSPDSRRHIVSAWDPGFVPMMALPPCHCFFQCYVANGELSLQIYQRSADCFLGLPFNIASYALLTMMLAKVCNLKPGALIWTGGDVHIYHNHLEQVQLQLTRTPYDLPKMFIKDRGQSIDDFLFEDFVLEGYECHPHIAGKVAV